MADFQLRVTADTQKAEKDLQRLEKTANTAAKERKLNIDVSQINKNFRNVEKNIKEASNTIQTFYRVSKNIPGVGERVREFENLAKSTAQLAQNAPSAAAALRENAKAGSILSNSFEAASAGAGRLVNNLAKAGFALFAVKEAVGVVRGAFSGFFNETIGREIKLRETILKTQTTLASTNKVFRNGAEITDPYEKIVALTGEVNKRIDSIRERSIALAGVTSNDVIEVFGIVASQVGQIGGGLKEAEDLAINFSAALGTFGIPLYQARQEIGSILRGDITMDSYLAKALGITNEDVARAKTQAGGVIKFLEERLAASVAGQRIAAQGFAGVVSNIRDLTELVSQRFGAGLLDPLLGGLTKVFDFLFKIREEVFAIASGMGRGLGQLLSTNLTVIGGGSALFGQMGAGAEGFAASITESVKKAFASLQRDANAFIAPLRNLFEEIAKSVGLVGAGLARLAQGFISIKIENFKALVQIFSNLSEAVSAFSAVLSQVLRAYGQLLQVPFVQYLSQISAQFQILEKIGVMSAVKLGFAAAGLIAAWTPIVTFFQSLVARIASLVGGVVIAVGAAFTRIGAVVAAFAATLTATYPAVEALKQQLLGLATSLTTAGAAADKAGVSVTRLGGASAAAARTASTAIMSFVKFNLILLAVQVAITVLVDLFGRFQRAQEEASSSKRAAEALRELQTKYKDVGDATDSATKSARDFRQALVDAEYGKNLDALEKVREKINQIRYELKPGIQSWREFWDALSGSEIGRFEERSRQALQALLGEEKRIKAQLGAVDKERDKQRISENIRLESDKRVNLEKEIRDLRKQQDDQLFQLRQQYAQKEVDIFRAAGELRIFQIEQANKKLIEGEEGASAAALEALNNYISVRERGELEIESAKKQLVIEVANLERQIADYRLENEKKIAEIRKRAGENDQKIADYQRQSAGQIAAGSGGGAATFGSTGNVSNAADWVHGHFQTNNGTLTDLISDVIPVLKSLLDKGIPVELSDGTRIQGGKDDAYYRRMLTKSAQQHRHSGDGRSLDLFVPEGTKVPVPLTNVTGNTGRGGITGGLPGTGKSWVGHLAPGSKAGGAGALVPPKLNDFSDIGAPAVAKYGDALRGVASAMERLRRIQEQLTGAKTKAAFEEIAKAAFKPVGLESYQDKLYELDGIMKSLADGTYDAFNPERSQIAAEQAAKQLSAQRELGQIEAGIRAQRQLSAQEQNAAIEAVRKTHQAFVLSLREEEKLRTRINAITQVVSFITKIQQETAQIERENEVIRKRNELLIKGVDPAVIEEKIKELKRAQELEDANRALNTLISDQTKLQEQLNKAKAANNKTEVTKLEKELAEAREKIKQLEEALKKAQGSASSTKPETPIEQSKNPRDIINNRIGNLKRELADLTNWGNIAVKAADGIGTAFAEAFRSVVTGAASVQDALGNMFGRIGEMFIQMATEIIAKMLIMYALKALLGLFGGGGGGGASAPATGSLVFAAEGAYWTGGFKAFENGGLVTKPTMGLVGEGGEPEYIIPASKMSAAMSRYSAGARGSAVIPSSGATTEGDTSSVSGGTAVAGGIDVRFNVERINSVDYVTADQFQAGIRQAAQQGATQGEQRTLRRLQQSRSTRSRLGLA